MRVVGGEEAVVHVEFADGHAVGESRPFAVKRAFISNTEKLCTTVGRVRVTEGE